MNTEGMQRFTVSGLQKVLKLYNLRGDGWGHRLKNLGLQVWNCAAEDWA